MIASPASISSTPRTTTTPRTMALIAGPRYSTTGFADASGSTTTAVPYATISVM